MADRIKGITIQIGADTKNLSNALSGINKQIKSTQAELKDVNRLLKLDPHNADLLVQKQQLLAKAIKESKDKLKELEAAQKQMDAAGVDKNSDAYQRLQREIIATKKEIGNLESQTTKGGEGLTRFAAAAGKVSEATAKAAEKTKGLSMAATGVLGAMGGLALKSAAAADELATLSRNTGISTDTLQEWGYASDLIDVSVEDMTGALTKLKKGMASDSVQSTLEGIGVSALDASGGMRDAESVFYDTLQALSQIENETERDQKAMAIFGKSADELSGIIDDGGAALRAYSDEAQQLGVVMDGETIAKTNELQDQLDKLKAEGSAAFLQLGASVAENLIPIIEQLTPILQQVFEFIGGISPVVIEIIGVIAGAIAVLSPLFSLISTISGVLSALPAIIAVLTGPIGLTVAAIAGVIAAIVALVTHFDQIKAAASAVVEKVKSVFTDLVNKAKTWGKDMIDNIVNGIKSKLGAVKDAVSGIAQTVKNFLGFSEPDEGPLSNFHTYMPDMIDLMAKGIKENMSLLNQPLTALAGRVSDSVQGAAPAAAVAGAAGAGRTTVNVTLQGDAGKLFKVIQSEARGFTKSTGRSAF